MTRPTVVFYVSTPPKLGEISRRIHPGGKKLLLYMIDWRMKPISATHIGSTGQDGVRHASLEANTASEKPFFFTMITTDT